MTAVQSQPKLYSMAAHADLEKIQAAYTVGQASDMQRILEIRTAQNSAGFLLPYIKPDAKILDVGCGPGYITCDFGALAPKGSVTGVDASVDALAIAGKNAEKRGLKNVTFLAADAAKLPFDDNTFDIAYSHQILIHAPKALEIMCEIRRVLKPGGKYGSREATTFELTMSPEDPVIRRSYQKFGELLRLNGSEPDAGNVNHRWAKQAGFAEEKIIRSEGPLSYVDGSERWTYPEGKMAREMVDRGVVTRKEMDEFRDAWKRFEQLPDSTFGLKCGEIVCEK